MFCPNCNTALRWNDTADLPYEQDYDGKKFIVSFWSCDEDRGGCKTIITVETPIELNPNEEGLTERKGRIIAPQ